MYQNRLWIYSIAWSLHGRKSWWRRKRSCRWIRRGKGKWRYVSGGIFCAPPSHPAYCVYIRIHSCFATYAAVAGGGADDPWAGRLEPKIAPPGAWMMSAFQMSNCNFGDKFLWLSIHYCWERWFVESYTMMWRPFHTGDHIGYGEMWYIEMQHRNIDIHLKYQSCWYPSFRIQRPLFNNSSTWNALDT